MEFVAKEGNGFVIILNYQCYLGNMLFQNFYLIYEFKSLKYIIKNQIHHGEIEPGMGKDSAKDGTRFHAAVIK